MARARETQIVLLILLLSCALGIAQALITPAWANVEEAGHFEYLRILAEDGRLPRDGEPNQSIRERILQSFVWKHHRWGSAGQMANSRLAGELGLRTSADWARLRSSLSQQPGYEPMTPGTTIGVSQFEEPPGYYLFALPLQLLLAGYPVEQQLLAARLASVLLGMVSVWLSYKAASEVFPGNRTIRIAAPALVALLPSFVVLSSAVNNTIAATAAVALGLYASFRLIRRGISVAGLVWLAAGVVACLISKTSAYFAVILAVLAVPMAVRRPWPRWVLPGAGVLLAVLAVLMLGWQWPASWYPVDERDAPLRADAQAGRRVIALDTGEGGRGLYQMIPANVVNQIAGETVTLGVWVRQAEGSGSAPLPGVWAAPNEEKLVLLPVSGAEVSAGEAWQFHAFTTTVPADTQCLAVRLTPFENASSRRVEYDGLALAAGERPLDEPPVFANRFATRGEWGAEPFANLVLNGSGERGQPLIRPEVKTALPAPVARYLNLNPRLATLLDWRANWPTLNQSVRWLFTSFWSRFASTNPGLPRNIVLALAVLSAVSGLGLALGALRAFRRIPLWQRRTLLLMLAASALVVGAAILRLDAFVYPPHCDFYQGRFISTGYYVIPGVLPLLMLWYVGLEQWTPRRWRRWLLVAVILGFFFMTVGSLLGRQIPDFLFAYGLDPAPSLWAWLWGWGQ